jgi:hypothetical protein
MNELVIQRGIAVHGNLIATGSITASNGFFGTSSWASTASFALNGGNGGGSSLITGSTVPITSSVALAVVSGININNSNLTGQTSASNFSASYIQTSDPIDSQQVATKNYVDNIAEFGVDYYFRSASSDIAGYNVMTGLGTALSSSATYLTTSNASGSQYIFKMISPAVNMTNIDPGNMDIHFNSFYSGIGAFISVVEELYIRSASVETLLGTTPPQTLSTNSTDRFTGTVVLTSSIVTNLTDRFVAKFKVNTVTLTPNVFLGVEGNTATRLTIPVPAVNFVSKFGDTMTGNLTSTGFTGSLFGTSSWANNATTSSYATFAQTLPVVLVSGSTYNITSSWASNSKTASFIGTGSNNTIPKWSNNTLVNSDIINNGTTVGFGVPVSITATTATVLSASVSIGPTNGVTDVISVLNVDPGNNQIFSLTTPNYKDPYLAIKDNLQTYVVNISPTGSVQFQNSASVTVGPNSGRFKLEVSGSIGPNQSGSFDLGSSVYTWRNIFGGLTGSHFGTSSYAINSVNAPGSSGTTLFTASTYQITSSWATNVVNGGGSSLLTGSTVPITASALVPDFSFITYTTSSNKAITASLADGKAFIQLPFTGAYTFTSSNHPTNGNEREMVLTISHSQVVNGTSSLSYPVAWKPFGSNGNNYTALTASVTAKLWLNAVTSGSVTTILYSLNY